MATLGSEELKSWKTYENGGIHRKPGFFGKKRENGGKPQNPAKTPKNPVFPQNRGFSRISWRSEVLKTRKSRFFEKWPKNYGLFSAFFDDFQKKPVFACFLGVWPGFLGSGPDFLDFAKKSSIFGPISCNSVFTNLF